MQMSKGKATAFWLRLGQSLLLLLALTVTLASCSLTNSPAANGGSANHRCADCADAGGRQWYGDRRADSRRRRWG